MTLKKLPYAALLSTALLVPSAVSAQTLASLEFIPGHGFATERRLPTIEVVNAASTANPVTAAMSVKPPAATLPLPQVSRGTTLNESVANDGASADPSITSAIHAEPADTSNVVDHLLARASGHRLALSNDQREKAAWVGGVDTGVPLRADIGENEVWVHIDVETQGLAVMRGSRRLETIDYVAFGANGVSPVRQQGSRVTPEGDFRIDHINPQSQFHRFFRIDYPNPAVADKALAEGVINQSTRDYIHRYYARHGQAPMDTPLGGHIGIHGLGNKDAYAHSRSNWTDGCKAVTNEEIRTIEPWLALGTRVIIE